MVEVQDCSALAFSSFREFPALAAEYAQESAIAGMPAPKHDEATYFRLERAGVLHMGVATIDKAMVGFILVLVSLNPHYSVKIGVIESFFVGAEHRRSGAGLLLKQWAEAKAKEQGARGLFVSAPTGSRLARVMEREKAYRETNRVFFRSFD